jgi:hypothetical protein
VQRKTITVSLTARFDIVPPHFGLSRDGNTDQEATFVLSSLLSSLWVSTIPRSPVLQAANHNPVFNTELHFDSVSTMAAF